jgi:flagellar biosynthetic protein FlhB
MAAGEKTEKATPKRRDEARKKGQVAKSADVSGSIVLIATFVGLLVFGPKLYAEMEAVMRETLALAATPDVVSRAGLGRLLASGAQATGLAVAPIALIAVVAGFAAGVAQVRWKPAPQAIKPDLKKLNPLNGLKNIFGKNAPVEALKSVVKVTVIGAIAALVILPDLPGLAALVGLPPQALAGLLVDTVVDVTVRCAGAYLVIAAADYLWQRHRHEKGLRMDLQEIKEEMKGYSLPAEVKGAQRRRQIEAARKRMMQDVPQADVVVTNPTHFAVALRYDGASPAPEVVAKGQDLLAAQIRRIAADAGVPVISDPPLARGLHASVEVGQPIPEDFFQAVAELLAFVYRAAGRKVA